MTESASTAPAHALPTPQFADLIAVTDIDEDYVDVPEWGYRVKVRGLPRRVVVRITTGELGAVEADILGLVEGVVDPPLTEDEARQLMEKSSTAVGRIVAKILELSKLGDAGFPAS